jgi:hypothetical protein
LFGRVVHVVGLCIIEVNTDDSAGSAAVLTEETIMANECLEVGLDVEDQHNVLVVQKMQPIDHVT